VSSYGGIVCPDYDPTCSASGISAPTTFSDPIGGFTGVPPPAGTAPDIPTTVAGSPDYTPPGFPAPLSPDTAPSIPGTTSGDYSNIADNAINEVIVRYEPDSTFLSDQLALIEQPGIDDYSRIAIANAYADAGIISPLAVNQVVASINEVRTGAGESALSVTGVQQVPSLPVYTADAASYDAAMAEAELVFTTWYGGDETSAILAFDRIFNTSEYSYGERLDNAEEQILSMNSPDLELNDTLANIVDTAFSIESYYPNGPL